MENEKLKSLNSDIEECKQILNNMLKIISKHKNCEKPEIILEKTSPIKKIKNDLKELEASLKELEKGKVESGSFYQKYALFYPDESWYSTLLTFGSLCKAEHPEGNGKICLSLPGYSTAFFCDERHLVPMEPSSSCLPIQQVEMNNAGWFELENGTRWCFYDLESCVYRFYLESGLVKCNKKLVLDSGTIKGIARDWIDMSLFQPERMSYNFAKLITDDFLSRIMFFTSPFEDKEFDVDESMIDVTFPYCAGGSEDDNIFLTLRHGRVDQLGNLHKYNVEVSSPWNNKFVSNLFDLPYELTVLFQNVPFDMTADIKGLQDDVYENLFLRDIISILRRECRRRSILVKTSDMRGESASIASFLIHTLRKNGEYSSIPYMFDSLKLAFLKEFSITPEIF